ncbi:MAG: serine/threonine protein kinase [Deltaproteobacteria bacterium]|nr:serine/threonine protein kinase [Deltaproteobacteria bacterium]
MNETVSIEQFGKYKLLRKIGAGGMAEVFLAISNDTEASTPIVVKRLHDELERDRDAVDLFLTEADVTIMLRHPNIIRVYDSGEAEGRYYIAMEYIQGRDLERISNRLAEKGINIAPDAAVHIMAHVLRGLEYVHQAVTPNGRPLGIVHRDVTPSNIFISAEGEVKLGDFGVAKLIAIEGWTIQGSIKGKLGYLSPEQIRGQLPNQSIDLWSTAVILFELLTGERLFTGDNELQVMLRIRDAKIPALRKRRRDAPKPLEKILKRALHRKERKRFATAADFVNELDKYINKYGHNYTPKELISYLSSILA